MPSQYVVRQGDHLRQLAAKYGFDPDTVWNDPANADIKQRRTTYNVLLPGDILQLPDPDPSSVPLQTGSTNAFTSPAIKPCTITHTFLRGSDPVANAKYRLIGSVDDATPLTTDGNGTATFDVPVDTDSVHVIFDAGPSFLLKIGHLDPAAEPSGAAQRLVHLGYLDYIAADNGTSDDDNEKEDRDQALAAALSAFQADNQLPATGQLDDATAQKLAAAYGC